MQSVHWRTTGIATWKAARHAPRAMADPILAALPAAIAHWRGRDDILVELAEETELEPWADPRDDPFASLATAIVHQQVSLAAGRTITKRLIDLVGELRAENVLRHGPAIRQAGVSQQKTGYILDLAARSKEGLLDELDDLDDEAIVERLTQVKGIGVWSAKMYLLFHLGRLDVCPWEDLGVRLSVERFYGVPEKEAAPWIRDTARPRWEPYNSVAARVLWAARRP